MDGLVGVDFLSSVQGTIRELKSFDKKTVFSVSTTAKHEDGSYLTPVRVCKDFVLAGCVIFDQKDLSNLLREIDGHVDIILSDSEKTIHLDANESDQALAQRTPKSGKVTISSICFHNIKTSHVLEFKPNDLTVNAVWSFLSQQLIYLHGKKICILGAGNIGSKLALKLSECGAKVRIYRRNTERGKQIVDGLNLIKSDGGQTEIEFYSDPAKASAMADVLIGATSGYPIIDENIIDNIKKNCLLVDLGKNNLTSNAIKIAIQNSMTIYRADVTPALESFIYEVLKMEDILENSYGCRSFDFCNIVGGGFFGGLGDIVVDRINNPTRIIGVAQGDGVLKRTLNTNDRNNINKIINKFDILKDKYLE